MSLELIKETVNVNQIIGEDRTRTVLDNDIIVPDTKPDISRILLLDGDVYISDTEAVQDRVQINGLIRYKILYASDDPDQPVKSINTSTSFQYSLNLPDTKHGMNARVKCDIEHIDYEVINSRKVNVKAIVEISGKVYNQQEQSLAMDFDGAEGIQVLKRSESVSSYLGSSETNFPVKELLEIPAGKPAVRDILRNDIKISDKDYSVSDGKVVAKGQILVSTLYIADDETGSIQYMEHEVPFTQFVDLNRADENSYCNLEYSIMDSDISAEEDNDGELRTLKCEITVGVYVEGYEKKDVEIIDDAYNPGYRLLLEKDAIRIEELAAEDRSQFVIKDTLFIDETSPEISEIFNVVCKPSLSDCVIENGKVTVEGVAGCNILYIAADAEQPVMSSMQEIPFKQQINVDGLLEDMECDVDLETVNCSFSMTSSKEVEIRLSVGVSVKAIRQLSVNTVTKAVEQALEDKRGINQPSLTIYFTQPGDTLWKVAKKYAVTSEEVRKYNDIPESGEISDGLQIIIPRKQ